MRTSAIAAALFFLSASAMASGAATTSPITPSPDDQLPNAVNLQDLTTAQMLLTKTAATLDRFRSDSKMLALLRQAKAVFVIPQFGHADSASGAHWGAGVLLANYSGHWSDPVFFTLGGGSLGQTVAKGGALILFIMSDRVLGKFQAAPMWSLNSGPGTTIVNYSAAAPQDLSGKGTDIIAWSAAGTPRAETQVAITDISFDTASNSGVYGTTNLRDILGSHTPYLNPTVISLVRQMPSAATTAAAQNRQDDHG
jgi:lipid-binding SYLF domain-containing protein